MFQSIKIADSHSHLKNSNSIQFLVQSAQKYNFNKFGVMSLSCAGISFIAQNLLCALAKIMYPEKIYAFGSLFYPEKSMIVDGQRLCRRLG